MKTTNTGEIQGRFKKGQSGNPAGKPKGARHKTTIAVQALMDGEGEEITRKAIELAKGGDITAIRLCLDRLMPPSRQRAVSIDLKTITTAEDAAAAMAAIIDAASIGDLTTSEAQALAGLVEQQHKINADALREKKMNRAIQPFDMNAFFPK